MAATVELEDMTEQELTGLGAARVDEEELAEAVRTYPILYDKSIKEFKDVKKKENAWKKVAESVVGITSAEDAKKRFQNLRARYTRDKQKVKRTKKSGGGADEVQEGKKETSELYPYLGWLDEHVINRRRSKGSLVAISDSSSLADESDDSGSDAKSDGRSNKEPESKAPETSTSEERYSKATGHKKWEKRDRKSTKFDVDNVEVEMLKCMTECLKKPVEQQKDEDELFGSFVASQLKTMQPQQNALAKFHINQICFQMKMPNMGITNLGYSGSQNTQGFPPSQNLAPIMNPQMPSHSFQQGDYNFIS